jgi:hypothetical protein|tara:strand:- start:9671 stop:9886 length:216 start_codon:yes stop_codon:yes gene_type:complete
VGLLVLGRDQWWAASVAQLLSQRELLLVQMVVRLISLGEERRLGHTAVGPYESLPVMALAHRAMMVVMAAK